MIEQLSAIHLRELRQFGPELHRIVGAITEPWRAVSIVPRPFL